MEEKKILARVSIEMWRRLRELAFKNEKSLNQICREAFEDYLEKEEKKN